LTKIRRPGLAPWDRIQAAEFPSEWRHHGRGKYILNMQEVIHVPDCWQPWGECGSCHPSRRRDCPGPAGPGTPDQPRLTVRPGAIMPSRGGAAHSRARPILRSARESESSGPFRARGRGPGKRSGGSSSNVFRVTEGAPWHTRGHAADAEVAAERDAVLLCTR
jgi:hypothetical protein